MRRTKPKRPLDRKVHVREDRQIFIAVEGRKTEEQYFAIFRHNPSESAVKFNIVIIKPDYDRSAPQHVLEKLKDELAKKEILENDEVWLMVDVDHWTKPNHIKNTDRVLQEATQLRYNLALSNPCFECWLIMHHAEPPRLKKQTSLSNDYKKHLATLIGGYDGSKLDVTKFKPYVSIAITRAKRLDSQPTGRIPPYPGSHVYKLVEKIGASDFCVG
jgi:hypothetical protein